MYCFVFIIRGVHDRYEIMVTILEQFKFEVLSPANAFKIVLKLPTDLKSNHVVARYMDTVSGF